MFCYILNLYSSTEAPVEFIKPLKDIQVMEKTKVTLECEVNKPNLIATWYLEGEEIKSDDRVELVVYDTVHQLIIQTTKLTDEGKYTIDVEGQKSSSTLLVDGKLSFGGFVVFIVFLWYLIVSKQKVLTYSSTVKICQNNCFEFS